MTISRYQVSNLICLHAFFFHFEKNKCATLINCALLRMCCFNAFIDMRTMTFSANYIFNLPNGKSSNLSAYRFKLKLFTFFIRFVNLCR